MGGAHLSLLWKPPTLAALLPHFFPFPSFCSPKSVHYNDLQGANLSSPFSFFQTLLLQGRYQGVAPAVLEEAKDTAAPKEKTGLWDALPVPDQTDKLAPQRRKLWLHPKVCDGGEEPPRSNYKAEATRFKAG